MNYVTIFIVALLGLLPSIIFGAMLGQLAMMAIFGIRDGEVARQLGKKELWDSTLTLSIALLEAAIIGVAYYWFSYRPRKLEDEAWEQARHSPRMSNPDEFLASLTPEEKVSISNLTPALYAAMIGEKNGTKLDLVTDDPNTQRAVPLLRKLETAELEVLLEAAQTCIRADTLANQGNLAQAANLYKQTIDLNPFHDLATMSYGTALASQGRLREGIRWVEKAIQVNPKNDRARRNLLAIRARL